MSAGNPLWEIHDAIWGLLEAHEGFCDLVASRKRLRYLQTAWDAVLEYHTLVRELVPCVAVIQTGIGPEAGGDRRASNRTFVDVRWAVLVASGDRRLDNILDVQWAVLRALMNWDDTMKSLTWEGQPYVVNCDLLDSSDGLRLGPELTKGLRGWCSVWAGVTNCSFPHTILTTN